MDVRERVLQAVDKGYPRNEIIELFGVSRATIKRYLKQQRETGEVKVRPIPGRPSKKFAPLPAGLSAQLQAYPDATLEFHCHVWEREQHQRVSTTTMGRAIRRMGWTRKKRRARATERDEEARAAWREHLKELDARQLVVIDECGCNIGLTPLSSRSRNPENERMEGLHAIEGRIRP